jgi:hypothetical protein
MNGYFCSKRCNRGRESLMLMCSEHFFERIEQLPRVWFRQSAQLDQMAQFTVESKGNVDAFELFPTNTLRQPSRRKP